jgi:hypothetical protein
MNGFNIKNFDDLKKIVKTVGPGVLKNLIPFLMGFILPQVVKLLGKVKNEELLRTQLVALLVLVIDIVDNVE